MKPDKILYVDDEAIALKYFERLVGSLAPVLTAGSVEEGRAVLRARGSEIAVLVSDQRMPVERGTLLLGFARQHYPHIVRMLTTAYSDLEEAIDAINTGEIYRYVTKPWELESLRADLIRALELSELRYERDELLQDRMFVQQGQLLSGRLGLLAVACAGAGGPDHERALFRLAQGAQDVGTVDPGLDWQRWDYAELQQSEAQRGAMVLGYVREWLQGWGPCSSDAQALDVLASRLGDRTADGVLVKEVSLLTDLLSAPAGEAVSADTCFWLAWLLWTGGRFSVSGSPGQWRVALAAAEPLPGGWLAAAMEKRRD